MDNKTLSLLLFASVTITQGTFASTAQEELTSQENSPLSSAISTLYSDECARLISLRAQIVEKYAPNNIARKSFNAFKDAKTMTIEVEGKPYTIAGLRTATPEVSAEIRKTFTDSLPHDYALFSNVAIRLNVYSITVSPDLHVQVRYSYTPGLLDRSGTSEYFLTVETPLSHIDRFFYTQSKNRVIELPQYQDLDAIDQVQQDLPYEPLWNDNQRPQNHFDELRVQAEENLKKAAEEYKFIRQTRHDFSKTYDSFGDDDKVMIMYFYFQSLQYRAYLTETAKKLHALSEEERFSDALCELQSNAKRFSQPLIEFPKWFKTKDKKAEAFKSYYSMWK